MTFEESFEAMLNDALLCQKSIATWAIFEPDRGRESSWSGAETFVKFNPNMKLNVEGVYLAFEVARETEKFIRNTFPETMPEQKNKMAERTKLKSNHRAAMLKSKPFDDELNLL